MDGYEVLSLLGRGGSGVVYKARDRRLKRLVALKLFSGSFGDPDALARFRREAEAIARLRHPNVVQIYDVGTQLDVAGNPCPYLALEYVSGGRLADHTGVPHPPRVAAELVESLARAAHAAHAAGIVHRDLKPANVLLASAKSHESATDVLAPETRLLTPKVVDFGLAKSVGGESQTVAGVAVGTPEYMAPEQGNGDGTVGAAADVYSLGVILYELLTGRVPFRGVDPLDTVLQVRMLDPVEPARLAPGLPRDLNTVCLKCLEKEPARRYASAAALADDLRAWLDGKPVAARPVNAAVRTWKWARRKPAVAGLIATLTAVAAMGFVSVSGQWRQAERQAAAERAAHAETAAARRDADAARDDAEMHLYVSRLVLAQHEISDGDVDPALARLEECRPRPGRPDLRGWEWHYLRRLAGGAKLAFDADHWVFAVAVSPDGRRIATAAGIPLEDEMAHTPGTVALWDAATGRRVAELAGHTGSAVGVEFSPDGRRLLTVGAEPAVRVWDVATGAALAGPVPVAFKERAVHWAEPRRYGPAWFVDGGAAVVFRSPDGWRRLDVATGAVEPCPGPDAVIARSPDGGRIARQPRFGTLAVEDAATGRARFDLKAPVTHAVLSADGRWLATAHDRGVQVWDGEDGSLAATFAADGRVHALAFSPDGKQVAAGGSDRCVRAWALDGAAERVFRGHGHEVRALAFHPDGQRLVSADRAGGVKVWDLSRHPRGDGVYLNSSAAGVSAIGLSADGGRAFALSRDHLELLAFDVAGHSPLGRMTVTTTEHFRFPRADHAFSGDGRLFAAPTKDDITAVGLWTADGAKPVATLRGLSLPVNALALSHDGRVAAAAGHTTVMQDGKRTLGTANAAVWDVTTGRRLAARTDLPAQALALSADGRLLAAYAPTGRLSVSDAEGNSFYWAVDAPWANVFGLAFSADGRMLASTAYETGTVTLWDAATGRVLRRMTDKPSLCGVTFSPDGRRVAAIGYDGDVRLWDTATGTALLTLRATAGPREADIGYSPRVCFSADGARLAANDWSAFLTVWDGRPE